MPKRTNPRQRKEQELVRRRLHAERHLARLPQGHVEELSLRVALLSRPTPFTYVWVRRRVSKRPGSPESNDEFCLWFDDPPARADGSQREPDATAPSAPLAAQRLVQYETWAR